MKFCPECGLKLKEELVDKTYVKKCDCGFIDWNNWVNVSAVVVCYNVKDEFLMVKLKENRKLTFPGGYRNLFETMEEAAKREFFEETGYQINNLKLFKVYTRDDLRLIWIVYTANLGEGIFKENSETEEIIFFTKNTPPLDSDLRGELTKNLLHDILMHNSIYR